MTELRFSGSTGRQPQAEARRYVYNVMCAMLANEFSPDQRDGWMFGGIEYEADLRRLKKALRAVMAELRRKADR